MARVKLNAKRISSAMEVASYRESDAERHDSTTSLVSAGEFYIQGWEKITLYVQNEHASETLNYAVDVAPSQNDATVPSAGDWEEVVSSTALAAADDVAHYTIDFPCGWARVRISASTGQTDHCRLAAEAYRTG